MIVLTYIITYMCTEQRLILAIAKCKASYVTVFLSDESVLT